MKKMLPSLILILVTASSFSQNPVSWIYSTKKIDNTTYEVHLKASLKNGWHLYAQRQPDNFIGTPTAIKFNKHPLVQISGTPIEIGRLNKKKQPTLDIESWEYKDDVDFVQRVTVKSNVKTNISGSIEFQVCTDKMCLQPATVNFSVPLE